MSTKKMDVKFRRKGSIVVIEAVSVPDKIYNSEFEGVDLTQYTVLSFLGKPAVDMAYDEEKLSQMRHENPNAFFLLSIRYGYDFDRVYLPKNFNPSKLRYYKSDRQLKKERESRAKNILRQSTEQLMGNLYSKYPEAQLKFDGEMLSINCNIPNAPKDGMSKYMRWNTSIYVRDNVEDTIVAQIKFWKKVLSLLKEETGETDFSSYRINFEQAYAGNVRIKLNRDFELIPVMSITVPQSSLRI